MMERIKLGTISTTVCPVEETLARFLDSGESPDIDISLINCTDLTSSFTSLQDGELDLLALPASSLHGNHLAMLSAECDVLGSRTPRVSNLILVSENKIPYQPKSAILLADSSLARRQLRRARRGLRVLSPEAHAGITEQDEPPVDPIERTKWMEGLRQSGDIDGFVIPRTLYSAAHLSARRHALLPEAQNFGDALFLPPAYSDLIVLVGRKHYPKSMVSKISEKEGESAWAVQNYLLGALSAEELDEVGVLVRHRQIASIMKQAENERDLTMEQTFHDTEGEVIQTDALVEIKLEIISSDGHRTIGLNRLTPVSGLHQAIVNSGKEWDILLRNAKNPEFGFLVSN